MRDQGKDREENIFWQWTTFNDEKTYLTVETSVYCVDVTVLDWLSIVTGRLFFSVLFL